jgi:uncharacterized protein YggE
MLMVGLGMLSVFSCPAAADSKPPALVTVTGDADVLVAPDEAVLRFAVHTRDKNLSEARARADRRTQGVLRVVKKKGVQGKHAKTDHVRIRPHYEYNTERVQYYQVHKSITVTVKDLDRLEAIMAAAFGAGANGLDSIQFRSTKLRKHRDRARLLAVKAAREKAGAMAAALGGKIGKPHAISEHTTGGYWGGWWQDRNVAQNIVQNVQTSPGGTGEAVAPGQIRINAKVTVSFILL